ncbi:hypothetical protein EIN_095910 [Entamoeba invadens IP1]|uniref:Uncharacterized protein n=1 Tax=Entamoeba invadens IP1 TaxID=370355 RepID=A0A0A1U0D1_ENTIV|nr:hypothetical protein EIN_095910 [Entamoeba invadens IP1]ELP87334.1 hypothetical protein EIN_095910 [Entamoeba invadens IP1]|eukprot:XP_004254105.1 hypothetical protein EIN_095910 [Entamoeba invadens IP1]
MEQLPSEPQPNVSNQFLFLDPMSNQVDKSLGYYPRGVPFVVREATERNELNKTIDVPEASSIPYWVLKPEMEEDTKIRNTYLNNTFSHFISDNQHYFLYQVEMGDVMFCKFDGKIQEVETIYVGGVVRQIGVFENNLWRDPGQCVGEVLFYIANENNVFVYTVTDEKPVLLREIHNTEKVEDVLMSKFEREVLIISTQREVLIAGVFDNFEQRFEVEYRQNDEGVVSIAFGLFPIIFIGKGYGLYRLDVLSGKSTVVFGYQSKILGLRSVVSAPFNLLVLTTDHLHLFDSRLNYGVQCFMHSIPRNEIMRSIDVLERDDKIVALIGSKKYIVIVPFLFNKEKKMFDKMSETTRIDLPVIVPINRAEKKTQITGFFFFSKNENGVLFVIDNERRVCAQHYEYGKIPKDIKMYPILLSAHHMFQPGVEIQRMKVLDISGPLQVMKENPQRSDQKSGKMNIQERMKKNAETKTKSNENSTEEESE